MKTKDCHLGLLQSLPVSYSISYHSLAKRPCQCLLLTRGAKYLHVLCSYQEKCPSVTFSFSFCPTTHTDMSDCLLSFLPHPLPRAPVLLQFNLADTILSSCLMPCMISIWCCDMILPALLYDIHLRATHMTTSSIGGVQIPIYLVSSTTDSL